MTSSISATLEVLGKNLKQLRKHQFPRDDQRRFATRLKVSRATYQKMEKGDPSIAMGSYFSAAVVLNVEQQFATLFIRPIEKTDLLEELGL